MGGVRLGPQDREEREVVQYLVLPLCLERGVLRVANIPAGLAVPTSEAPVKVKD